MEDRRIDNLKATMRDVRKLIDSRLQDLSPSPGPRMNSSSTGSDFVDSGKAWTFFFFYQQVVL